MPTISVLRTLPVAIALGALAACGFAPLELWPLTLLALAGLLVLAERVRGPWPAAAIGWGFGFGHFCVGLNWIATAFTFQAAMPAWLGWVAVVLLSLYLAVFPAIAIGAARWIAQVTGAPLPFAAGAGWIMGEWLRATLFTGFAWNPIAAIWVPLPGAAAAAALVGTYGVSGLTLLLAGALTAIGRRRETGPAVLALIVVVLLAGAGLMIRAWPVGPIGTRLRVVQPNVSQADKWRPDAETRNFARLVRLTGAPTAAPRLVLWPEVAIPWYLEEDAGARGAIAALLGPRDLLLTGGIAVRRDAAGDIVAATNSLFGLDAAGRLLGRYDKSHLVPYGEYLPMRPLLSRLGLSRLAPGDMDFDAGPGPRDIALPGIGPVGGQVCYEIVFSGRVVDEAHRPRFLFNPSNDAWFGRWGPPQHLAQAQLRAIEEGMAVVRSTPTGISAVIDARGRLVAALPWHTAGAIDARLPGLAPVTPFARAGNVAPLLLAWLLAVLGAALGIARRRRGG